MDFCCALGNCSRCREWHLMQERARASREASSASMRAAGITAAMERRMVASAEVAMATPNADRWIDRMAPAPPVELLEHDAAEVLADWYEDLGFRAGRPTADAEEREPDDEDPSPPRWVSGYEFIVQPVFEDGPAAGTPWADGPGGLWR